MNSVKRSRRSQPSRQLQTARPGQYDQGSWNIYSIHSVPVPQKNFFSQLQKLWLGSQGFCFSSFVAFYITSIVLLMVSGAIFLHSFRLSCFSPALVGLYHRSTSQRWGILCAAVSCRNFPTDDTRKCCAPTFTRVFGNNLQETKQTLCLRWDSCQARLESPRMRISRKRIVEENKKILRVRVPRDCVRPTF